MIRLKLFLPFLIPAAIPAVVCVVIGLFFTGDVDAVWFGLGSVAGALGYVIYDELDKNVKE